VYAFTLLALSARFLYLVAVAGGIGATTPTRRRSSHPVVTVRMPIYNERRVAERVIAAACRLDWPRDRAIRSGRLDGRHA
jgi:cellulose synthase/poly-beta-1,6-N-acetylglucosamine synthase-like glycosyltransferase